MEIIAIKNNKLFNEKLKEELFKFLTLEEIHKIEKNYSWKDRQNFLLGRIVVKIFISKIYNISIEKIKFKINSYGKPYYFDSNIHFNISHSNNWVVIALDTQPVGIDIEEISNFKTFEFKNNFFSVDEKKCFSGINNLKGKNSYFTELWTVKESFAKLLGFGLNISLNNVSTVKYENNYLIISNLNLYYIKQYEIDKNYKLSVCSSEKNNFPSSIEVLDNHEFIVKYFSDYINLN